MEGFSEMALRRFDTDFMNWARAGFDWMENTEGYLHKGLSHGKALGVFYWLRNTTWLKLLLFFFFLSRRPTQHYITVPSQRVPVWRNWSLHSYEQTVQRGSGLHRWLGWGSTLQRYHCHDTTRWRPAHALLGDDKYTSLGYFILPHPSETVVWDLY